MNSCSALLILHFFAIPVFRKWANQHLMHRVKLPRRGQKFLGQNLQNKVFNICVIMLNWIVDLYYTNESLASVFSSQRLCLYFLNLYFHPGAPPCSNMWYLALISMRGPGTQPPPTPHPGPGTPPPHRLLTRFHRLSGRRGRDHKSWKYKLNFYRM